LDIVSHISWLHITGRQEINLTLIPATVQYPLGFLSRSQV
jgi:hypothetical protein